MTVKNTFPVLLLTVICVAFLSNSNGVAHQQNKDRTGAPGSDNTCQQCHSGGNFNTEVAAFLVAEGDIALADSYVPGATHTLVVNVTGSGTPNGYGVHGTAVFEDGTNAGTFNDQDANDCIWLDEVNGRHIFEQNDLCSSGSFEIEWVAPEVGSGPVTVYVASIAANGNGTASGDAFGGGSFTFNEGQTSQTAVLHASDFTVHSTATGLALTGPEPSEITVISLDGRVLFEGEVIDLFCTY